MKEGVRETQRERECLHANLHNLLYYVQCDDVINRQPIKIVHIRLYSGIPLNGHPSMADTCDILNVRIVFPIIF